MSLLDSLSFDRLLWLVPVFFMLHNMEEVPFMENWTKRLPSKIHPPVSTRQFVIAVTFLTLAGFLVTYFGVEYLQNTTGYLLVIGIQAILFVNAFVPHIASMIRFRMYSPGAVTAILVTIPFSVFLFRRALVANVLDWRQLWILLGIAPFAMVIFAYISLQLGKVLDT